MQFSLRSLQCECQKLQSSYCFLKTSQGHGKQIFLNPPFPNSQSDIWKHIWQYFSQEEQIDRQMESPTIFDRRDCCSASIIVHLSSENSFNLPAGVTHHFCLSSQRKEIGTFMPSFSHVFHHSAYVFSDTDDTFYIMAIPWCNCFLGFAQKK